MERSVWAWTSVLFCNEFVRAALFYVWVPLIVPHVDHVPIGWVGFCTSCQFAADAATKLCYGIAAARGYARLLLRCGSAVSVVSVVTLLFVHNATSLWMASVLFGFGAASIWPAALSHYGRQTEGAKGESLAKAFVPWMTGTGVGMFLPNVLLHHRPIIKVVLVFASLVVFACTWLIQPSGRDATPSLRREVQLVRILSRKVKIFLPPMLIQTLIIGTVSPYLALFAVKSLHLHPEQYALLLIGIGVMTVCLLIPFGKVSDKLGRLPLLCAAFFTSSCSIVALAISHTWGQAFIPGVMFGVSFGVVFPAWNALFMEAVPHWLHTRAVGLFTSIEDSGTALGPLVGALSWQYIGPTGPFLLSGSLMALLAVYFAVWWKRSLK
ncbi:MFS transporter [Alicyclobacillus pomorum]|jgi:MFS transporter, DHA1 family, multidrug resistance protein|uniref:MFS transporter n=1 Tax=Alicyclobacillus pomorum TaxID=204470 RepID=UPI00040E6186|nr:MFS transporter [Alicyclobacillus pomorum]